MGLKDIINRQISTLCPTSCASIQTDVMYPAQKHRNVECKSADTYVGKFATVLKCAEAVKYKYGGSTKRPLKYFVYGNSGDKNGKCYAEHTRAESGGSSNCPEGYKGNSYDYYKLAYFEVPIGKQLVMKPRLVKSNAECRSADFKLGKFDTLEGCATAVKGTGEQFFIYGNSGNKKGLCYAERTISAACKEGWKANSYDFYDFSYYFTTIGAAEPRSSAEKLCGAHRKKVEICRASGYLLRRRPLEISMVSAEAAAEAEATTHFSMLQDQSTDKWPELNNHLTDNSSPRTPPMLIADRTRMALSDPNVDLELVDWDAEANERAQEAVESAALLASIGALPEKPEFLLQDPTTFNLMEGETQSTVVAQHHEAIDAWHNIKPDAMMADVHEL